MKKLGFLLVGAASLALAACGSNEADTVNDAEAVNMGAEALNNLAESAANEVEALGNQAQQLEAENTAAEVAADPAANETSPSEVEDDVQGM